MKEFLIDMPTLTSFWVTAASEEAAIEALYEATAELELRLHIGTKKNPVELINTTCRHGELGDYEIVSDDEVNEPEDLEEVDN